MSDLHPNVVRVVEAARALGLEITTRRFPEGTKTAQDAANHMARISRIGHFGGNRGYEGVGMGSTAYAAEMACCFRQRMQPREVGLAQNASGVWFACCRY